jgi:hypothetical protein
MWNQLILVIAVLLSGSLPAEAQTLAAHGLLVQARSGPTTIVGRASLAHFPPKFSLASGRPRMPAAQFTGIPAYKPDDLESPLMVEEVSTLFLTESRLAVVQFWKGHLYLEGFDSTRHMQSIWLGPSGSGGLPPIHDQAGVARRSSLDGISLGFRFGRDGRTVHQPKVWRCLGWIRGESHGCRL